MSRRTSELARQVEQTAPMLDPKDPLAIARELLAVRFSNEKGHSCLAHWRGDFWHHEGVAYAPLEAAELNKIIWDYLGNAICRSGEDAVRPFKPTIRVVAEVREALTTRCLLPKSFAPPAWRESARDDYPSSDELLPVANGLLHVTSGRLYDPTPELFVTSALPVAFDPNAARPTAFLKFLEDLWDDDHESISALLQWFGYLLTSDTRQQKILLIAGPSRSGKGTIGRILTALVGRQNVAAPTLQRLTSNFGRQDLIGKSLALVSDARIGRRADEAAIVESLLSISGEDHVSIDRKYRDHWTGKLPTRFVIMSNELLRLSDAADALTRRFIVLELQRSFLDNEDHRLTERLMTELPGILNLALDGLEDLRARGKFIQPASARDAITELSEMGSPVKAFVEERCIRGAGQEVTRADLYNAFCDWIVPRGWNHPPTQQTFVRDLRAAVPGLTSSRPRTGDGDKRERRYVGIGLRASSVGLPGPGPVRHAAE